MPIADESYSFEFSIKLKKYYGSALKKNITKVFSHMATGISVAIIDEKMNLFAEGKYNLRFLSPNTKNLIR